MWIGFLVGRLASESALSLLVDAPGPVALAIAGVAAHRIAVDAPIVGDASVKPQRHRVAILTETARRLAVLVDHGHLIALTEDELEIAIASERFRAAPSTARERTLATASRISTWEATILRHQVLGKAAREAALIAAGDTAILGEAARTAALIAAGETTILGEAARALTIQKDFADAAG